MIVIFVEFIDQLIDYPINRASLSTSEPSLYLTPWPPFLVVVIEGTNNPLLTL